ncbi:hypothetical protein AB0K89_28175 [Streptomyces cinnamoneus]|uniref:hypothetical protein n=1 Tax=Streptomyces cinnamoneus TaxID=53446 RepID=UPI003434A9E9
MIRVITGATHEQYEKQAEQARRVPGLEQQLAEAEERAAMWEAQATGSEHQRRGERELLQQILTEVRALRGEPWPEGVFARYQNVAGAHIDLFQHVSGNPHWRCTACPETSVGAYTNPFGHPFSTKEIYRQAQDHAATCRALPKP